MSLIDPEPWNCCKKKTDTAKNVPSFDREEKHVLEIELDEAKHQDTGSMLGGVSIALFLAASPLLYD